MNELRIISGLHRGVSLPLDGDTIIVGSSLDADIVLVDPGVAKQHIKFETTKRLPPNCWKVHILNKDTWDARGELVKDGSTAKLNMSFNIGGVWLNIAEEDAAWPRGDIDFVGQKAQADVVKGRSSMAIKVPLIAAGVLAGLVTLTHAGGSSNETPLLVAGLSDAAPNKERIAALGLSDQVVLSDQEYLKIFKKMLRERRLEGVKINADEQDWTLSGELEQRDLDVLKRMLVRFKHKHGSVITIQNETQELTKNLPFQIVKVISGPYGHVESKSGDKIYIGNEYMGFKLVGISNNIISFTGKQDLEIKW